MSALPTLPAIFDHYSSYSLYSGMKNLAVPHGRRSVHSSKGGCVTVARSVARSPLMFAFSHTSGRVRGRGTTHPN